MLKSPTGKVEVSFSLGPDGAPLYSVTYAGKPVVADSRLGLTLRETGPLAAGFRVTDVKRASRDETYTLAAGKTGEARDRSEEMTVSLERAGDRPARLDVVFRAFDDGAAFRYVLPKQGALHRVEVLSEETRFRFLADHKAWVLQLPSFDTSNEGEFVPMPLLGIGARAIDAGWYGDHRDGGADITRTVPGLDIPGLVAYGKARNVRLMVWLNWEAARDQMDVAFPLYEKWGLAGVKIDYMDRKDQEIVAFYHRAARTAAKHHLLVDFHGAYAGSGEERTFPNWVTREGILGLEYLKWSDRATPRHNVTIPFTRMILGPMDYTPGGFRNVSVADFSPRNELPLAMGTRAHQLAMYVVYRGSSPSRSASFPTAPSTPPCGPTGRRRREPPRGWPSPR